MGLGRFELEEPGAVGELVLGVKLGVVRGAALPHLPKDFQPALAQAAQGAGVGFAALARGFVIDLCPTALVAAEVGPEVDRGAQQGVAVPADAGLVELAGLEADRRGARVGLEGLGIPERGAVRADLGQQPRGELRSRARQ